MTPETPPLVVELYEHVDFGGQMIIMMDSDPDLENYGFSNKVSSIRVLPGPSKETSKKVRLHRDAHYKGGYIEVKPGEEIPDLKNSNYIDTVSSIEFI
jgi:hypothetical protein